MRHQPSPPLEGAPAEGALRARRRRETEAGIRAAARTLVQRHGLEAVTVQMISEAAGISVRTFFNYMPSKEAALIASPPPLSEQAADPLQGALRQGEVLEAIEELLVGYCRDTVAQHLELASGFDLARQYDPVAALMLVSFDGLEKQLSTVIEAGGGRCAQHADLVAAVAIAAFRVALHRWSRRAYTTTPEIEIRRSLREMADLGRQVWSGTAAQTLS